MGPVISTLDLQVHTQCQIAALASRTCRDAEEFTDIDSSADFRTRPDSQRIHTLPKGPSTNMMRTLVVYIGSCCFGWAKYSSFEALDPLGMSQPEQVVCLRRGSTYPTMRCTSLKESRQEAFPGSRLSCMCLWVVVKTMVPFLGPLNTRCCIMVRTQKGTIILTTTHMDLLRWCVLMLALGLQFPAAHRSQH